MGMSFTPDDMDKTEGGAVYFYNIFIRRLE